MVQLAYLIALVDVKEVFYMRPSEEFEDFWLRARNGIMTYPERIEGRSGKWLIFLPKGQPLDEMWVKVKWAIHAGKLGRSAKVSTMRANENEASPGKGVICVYTYSLDDLEDARRVRQALRDLGITWKIPYKLDADVGRYSNRGETGLSKLYE